NFGKKMIEQIIALSQLSNYLLKMDTCDVSDQTKIIDMLKSAASLRNTDCSISAGFVLTLLFYSASALYLSLKKRKGIKIHLVVLLVWTYLVLSGNTFLNVEG
ncbi:hypothetical protein, partial [uncultured Acinetobacter sp.]|uniref:hypothetical protein n=1 Tax=uncultured Acinetobacter sp. TaxID=165433 RepID=UPI002610BA8B